MISWLLSIFSPKRRPRCYELVGALALRRGGIGHIHIFEDAGMEWGFSKAKIKADFERYLNEGCTPRYVKKFCEKRVTKEDLELYKLYLYKVG